MRFRAAGTRLGGWALDLSLDHQQRTTYDAPTSVGAPSTMLKRVLGYAVTASVIAVVAGIGWIGYGKLTSSEGAEFDESVSMVHHQTGSMSESFGEAGTFVSRDIKQITSISVLIDEWTPRYDNARITYQKFDSAIIAAERRAEAYFSAQRALTERYHSPESRVRAQAHDDSDFALYLQWRDRAHRVRAEALEIVNRLSDMDTDLRKLDLSSDFSGFSYEAGSFSEVPSDIRDLGDALTQFQIASENIREITASPFDLSRYE